MSLLIDGQPVLSGELPVTAKAPLTLAKGPHAIYCSYTSKPTGEARVRLMWSSPLFRPEPVPASAFRFIPGAEIASWGKVRAGRELFKAAHCINCHAPRGGVPRDVTPELLATVPDFNNIGRRIEAAWLEQWVRQPQGYCPTIAPQQATDVAAYLATLKESSWRPEAVPAEAKVVAEGAALVEKLHLGFWVEPLTKSRKHTEGGLVEQLQQPARHHADTLFPDVRLTRAEAQQVAAYVRSKQPAPLAAAAKGNTSAGQAMVTAACAACHDRSAHAASLLKAAVQTGSARRPEPLSFEEIARSDWTVKGCVSENKGRAPNFRFDAGQVALLIALRNADRDVGLQSFRRWAPAEYVASQVKALNCVQCHAGGGENKLPDITFAGEKFDQAWLAALLAGKHPKKIRPWQEARMPEFASRAANLAMGFAAKQGVPLKTPAPAPKADLIPIGAAIAGETGYSCIACHDAGSRKALQVFEGQGPNLQLAGERLRYDYYQRWTHWPQRIAPATIMPRYTKDREHALLDAYLGGEAEKQFEAVWQWMKGLGAAGK